MFTKKERYDRQILPLVKKIIELAEENGINLSVVGHIDEGEGHDTASLVGATNYNGKNNGPSPHIIACHRIANVSQDTAMKINFFLDMLERDEHAAGTEEKGDEQ